MDAGCGAGRFAELFANAGAEIVGLDLSLAVDAAYYKLGRQPGVHIAQADLMHIPLRQQSFDLVFSPGVLHHTVSAERAFSELTRFVKPGGYLAVWVYARSPRAWTDALDDAYRPITRRIPIEALYGPSHVAVPLGVVLRKLQLVPRIGPRLVGVYLVCCPKISLHPTGAGASSTRLIGARRSTALFIPSRRSKTGFAAPAFTSWSDSPFQSRYEASVPLTESSRARSPGFNVSWVRA